MAGRYTRRYPTRNNRQLPAAAYAYPFAKALTKSLLGPAAAGFGVKSMINYWNKSNKTLQPRYAKRTRFIASRRLKGKKTTDKKQNSQIRQIQQKLNADTGTLIFRTRATGEVEQVSANEMTMKEVDGSIITRLQSALAELRYYDINTPGTLVQASGETGTYSRDFLFTTVYSKLTCRNNYKVPCKLTVYKIIPKKDTSIIPLNAFTQGLADVGNPSSVSCLVHLTDSQTFTDLYKIVKTESMELAPGEQFICSHSHKGNINYDTSYIDSHDLTYQASYGSHSYIIRVEGVLAHDTTVVGEQGTTTAGLDYMVDRKVVIQYAAGASIKYIVVANNSDAFTNAGQISNNPQVEQQQYSR